MPGEIKTTTWCTAMIGDYTGFLSINETYRIIDPELPYADRSERTRLTLSIGNGQDDPAVYDITPDQMVDLGLTLASIGWRHRDDPVAE